MFSISQKWEEGKDGLIQPKSTSVLKRFITVINIHNSARKLPDTQEKDTLDGFKRDHMSLAVKEQT